MTPYDLLFLALLAVSCFAGVVRGGTKELVNLIAFFVALLLAVVGQPFFRTQFHLELILSFVAAFVFFLLVYAGIRILGHRLSERIQKEKALNTFDRVLGFGIGFFRTLVVLGVFHLIFSYVTPIEHQPHWFRDAKIHPLSVRCAQAIQAFIPAGTGVANRVAAEKE